MKLQLSTGTLCCLSMRKLHQIEYLGGGKMPSPPDNKLFKNDLILVAQLNVKQKEQGVLMLGAYANAYGGARLSRPPANPNLPSFFVASRDEFFQVILVTDDIDVMNEHVPKEGEPSGGVIASDNYGNHYYACKQACFEGRFNF